MALIKGKVLNAFLTSLMLVGLNTSSVVAHSPMEHAKKHAEEKVSVVPTPVAPYVVNVSAEAMSHKHNKLVHFPVALGCLALIFALLSLRWPAYHNTVRVLLALGTVSAWFAV